MKKLILALLLCSTFAFGQTKIITWYRLSSDSSILNYNPFTTGYTVKTGYYNINPKTGEQYRYAGSGTTWIKDSLFKDGSTTIVNNNTYNTTTTSGGTGVYVDYSPEMYGAVNQLKTFSQANISQTKIDSTFPGMGFTTSDYIDWAAWQMCITQASTNGGGVKARGGTYYLGPKSLTAIKYAKNFQLDGNYSVLVSTGTSAIITRSAPTDNSDANTMVELKYTIKNITLNGTATQIGIDIGPSYGAYYQNVMASGLLEGIHLRFALRTTIDNCFSTNCNRGWIVDMGNWSGATNSNYQSNHTTIRSCRYYGNGDVAIGIYAASGCVVEDCIIEGTSVRVGIDVDGNSSTVVKDITIRNTHFECASGATEAFIKIRLGGGIATIDKVFGQYASILIDAGATSGYLNVVLSNVPYWVFKGGKAFNNAGGVSWVFLYNDNSLFTTSPSTTVPTWFNGTAVSLCGGGGCGSNRFFYTSIPR